MTDSNKDSKGLFRAGNNAAAKKTDSETLIQQGRWWSETKPLTLRECEQAFSWLAMNATGQQRERIRLLAVRDQVSLLQAKAKERRERRREKRLLGGDADAATEQRMEMLDDLKKEVARARAEGGDG